MSLMVAQEVPTSTTMALPHGPAGVAEARRRLRADLYARDVPDPVVDDAVLILSELLSNSCRHARPLSEAAYPDGTVQAGAQAPAPRLTAVPTDRGTKLPADPAPDPDADYPDSEAYGIRAFWSVGPNGLLNLEVTDGGGPTRPRPASPSLTARGGRGLGIVAALALRWGVRDAPGEVTVWVLLPVRGRHARRDNPTGIGLPRGVPLDLPLDLAESLDDMT
ncbi:ATP-binding protein [Streptomyces sp. KK5PA1]|uniref:ATP-binding protein n=1 Tax=Actinacidiphila acididurans TaxID=2784346 RepID=A0ABS2TRS8_9ACTN|nr:ATP-binding protein [Actinacidiphila acididurans]MBM9506029.1 ATP-binding protein [Actinacidiphila acididurans]